MKNSKTFLLEYFLVLWKNMEENTTKVQSKFKPLTETKFRNFFHNVRSLVVQNPLQIRQNLKYQSCRSIFYLQVLFLQKFKFSSEIQSNCSLKTVKLRNFN